MSCVHDHAVHLYGGGQPAIIFGHGIGGDQGQWDPLVQHFSRTNQVVTFSLAGSYEASPSLFSPVRHASIMGYADDLALLVAEMDIRGAVYVGHSLSAMAGVLASVADPAMFSRLVLLNGCARYVSDPSDGYIGAFSQQEVDDLLLAIAADFTAWSSGFAAIAMRNDDRPEFAAEFTRSLSSYDPGVTLTMFRAAFCSDFRSVVPKVQLPTLVLQSACDAAVPNQAAEWLAGALPDGHLRLLPATGHFPHVVTPHDVITEIEAFGLRG